MKKIEITNENVMSIDYAREERQAFLRSIHRESKRVSKAWLAPGLPAKGVWMTDVSIMDRRSVKAQLAGRGDWRPMWWALNCQLHRLLHPQASLEDRMMVFHQRHHRLTLWRVSLSMDYRELVQTIYRHGWREGVTCVMRQLQRPERGAS